MAEEIGSDPKLPRLEAVTLLSAVTASWRGLDNELCPSDYASPQPLHRQPRRQKAILKSTPANGPHVRRVWQSSHLNMIISQDESV
jgi:hypothetical protein